jgi:uncharacterized protein YcfL
MNILQRNLLIIVLAFVLFPMVACQTVTPVPDEPEPTFSPEPTFFIEEFFAPLGNKVVGTADSIVVMKVRVKKFTDGGMIVDFTLYNNRGRRNVINYRVQWFDEHGMMATPNDSWSTIAFEGQQEMIITVTSPGIEAIDYRLELQTN